MMMSALLADEADGLLEPVQRHGGLVLLGAHVDVGDRGAGLIRPVDLFGDLFGLSGQIRGVLLGGHGPGTRHGDDELLHSSTSTSLLPYRPAHRPRVRTSRRAVMGGAKAIRRRGSRLHSKKAEVNNYSTPFALNEKVGAWRDQAPDDLSCRRNRRPLDGTDGRQPTKTMPSKAPPGPGRRSPNCLWGTCPSPEPRPGEAVDADRLHRGPRDQVVTALLPRQDGAFQVVAEGALAASRPEAREIGSARRRRRRSPAALTIEKIVLVGLHPLLRSSPGLARWPREPRPAEARRRRRTGTPRRASSPAWAHEAGSWRRCRSRSTWAPRT